MYPDFSQNRAGQGRKLLAGPFIAARLPARAALLGPPTLTCNPVYDARQFHHAIGDSPTLLLQAPRAWTRTCWDVGVLSRTWVFLKTCSEEVQGLLLALLLPGGLRSEGCLVHAELLLEDVVGEVELLLRRLHASGAARGEFIVRE